ncbi:MAG TPA: hypothetical protein VHN18_01775 [Micromonosporaceae bacterium]|nr:hypothetical protein [Micromonosporaceae bacterium]
MSDPLDVLFDQLRTQLPPVPFVPPELIRRRGRQRAHRQALTVGLAMLSVVGVGGGLPWLVEVDGTPGPAEVTASPSVSVDGSATPGPTTLLTPGPTDVPSTVMLRPPDLGAGMWTQLQSEGVFKGEERWYWADWHEGYRAEDYPSRSHQLDQRVVRYEGDPQGPVEEIVERYDSGWGSRNMADIRAVVAKSGATPYAPPGRGGPLRHTIVETGFAGDESLLIERKNWSFDGSTTIPQNLIQFIAVVRVGDLVATVIPPLGAEPDVARTLAVAAAERLK